MNEHDAEVLERGQKKLLDKLTKASEDDVVRPVVDADGVHAPHEHPMYAPGNEEVPNPLHDKLPASLRRKAADQAKREEEALAEGLEEMRTSARAETPSVRRSPEQRIRASVDLLMAQATRSYEALGRVEFPESMMREIFGAYWEMGHPLDDATKLKIEEYAKRALESAVRRVGRTVTPEVHAPVSKAHESL